MLGGWMGGGYQIFYKLQRHVYVCLLICLLYEFSQCYKHTIPFSFAIAIPFSYHIQPGLQFDLEVHKQTDFITLRCHLVGNIVIKMLLRKCQHFGMTPPPHCENSQLFFFEWILPLVWNTTPNLRHFKILYSPYNRNCKKQELMVLKMFFCFWWLYLYFILSMKKQISLFAPVSCTTRTLNIR